MPSCLRLLWPPSPLFCCWKEKHKHIPKKDPYIKFKKQLLFKNRVLIITFDRLKQTSITKLKKLLYRIVSDFCKHLPPFFSLVGCFLEADLSPLCLPLDAVTHKNIHLTGEKKKHYCCWGYILVPRGEKLVRKFNGFIKLCHHTSWPICPSKITYVT